MITFYYKAKSGPHRVVEGHIDAENDREAHEKLVKQGLFPILVTDAKSGTLKKVTGTRRRSKRKGKVRVGDLALFTFHLSNLISSGLTLVRTLDLLSEQIEHAKLAEVCAQLQTDIRAGLHFSDALEKYPGIFSSLLVNTVRAGETGGSLEEVLKNLSDTYEREEETRSKVKAALTYPIIVLSVAVVMVTALLIFVVPKLTSMYDDLGQTLPLITRIVVGVSNFLIDFGWLIGLAIFIVIWMIRGSLRQQKGRRTFYSLFLTLPILGELARRTDMASFGRVLGMLLASGVSILEAMRVTESVMTLPMFIDEITLARGEVTQGTALSKALSQREVFPSFVTQMIAIGEESGDLDNALLRVARTYDRDIERRMKTVTTILEPVMILIVGVIVGVIFIAMLLPIFQINLIV